MPGMTQAASLARIVRRPVVAFGLMLALVSAMVMVPQPHASTSAAVATA